MPDLATLLTAPRVKIVAELAPIAGTRFQPTGFPDLGPATYVGPDGSDLLLVESAQSMANRLEAQLWPVGADAPAAVVAGLPYVRVTRPDGSYLTSSRTESHRLASAYVKAARIGEMTGLDLVKERFGLEAGSPLDHARISRALFALDPLTLLHGAFFADQKWPGQPKVARAVTAFVEARGVRPAHSGGVKLDHVSNTGDVSGREGGKKASEEGFGNVPFPRTEFVAELIEASFVIDTSQIAGYALQDPERELLLALALYEIRGLLAGGLRLRTACDLEVQVLRTERPAGFELPPLSDLEGEVQARLGIPAGPILAIFGG